MTRRLTIITLVLLATFASIPAVAQPTVQPAAVLVMQVDDVSGTMETAIRALARNEADQYERSLRPGDAFVRVEFDCEARLSQLAVLRTAEDIANLTRVLGQLRSGKGDTCISAGLEAGRSIAEEAKNRRLILILTTDGLTDPRHYRPIAEERQLLADAAAWWRARTDIVKVLVAVERGPQSQHELQALAEALDARTITLDAFGSANIIERTVEETRTTATPPPARPLVTPAGSPRSRRAIVATVASVAALVVGALMLMRTASKSRAERHPCPAPLALPDTFVTVPPRRYHVRASVTVEGCTTTSAITLPDDLPVGRLTFGDTGTVIVPGLAGSPLHLYPDPESDRLVLDVAPDTPVWVDGQQVTAAGGCVPVARGFTVRRRSFVSVTISTPSEKTKTSPARSKR